MNSLAWRVATALIAVAILLASYIAFEKEGLTLVCCLVIFLALWEFKNIGFARTQATTSYQLAFFLISLGLFAFMVQSPHHSLSMFSACLAVFYALGLWLNKDRLPNVKLLTALGVGTLGFMYCVAFPALAIRTLLFPDRGELWFVALMLIVSAGDTGAYFGGRFFGKKKLMPSISPKKTVEGAISGAVCSGVFGVVFFYWAFPELNPLLIFAFAITTGIIAQCGDLFISLFKRVADVKDSGRLLPGHGGFLDRLDGVYIAAPIVHGFVVLARDFHWLN